MRVIEIRNNLVKLSFEEGEIPVLGKFITLSSAGKSYVAQFVNIKAEVNSGFAVARLLFTFTGDGVVDSYDGSTPSISSEVLFLSSDELLDLLPVETPVKIGNLAQQDSVFNIDVSVFEHNFTVFAEHDFERASVISNCTRQLFQMKERSVIIDNDNLFEDYEMITGI